MNILEVQDLCKTYGTGETPTEQARQRFMR